MSRQESGCLIAFVILFLIVPFYFISLFFSSLSRAYNRIRTTEEERRWRKASTVGILLLAVFALYVLLKVSI